MMCSRHPCRILLINVGKSLEMSGTGVASAPRNRRPFRADWEKVMSQTIRKIWAFKPVKRHGGRTKVLSVVWLVALLILPAVLAACGGGESPPPPTPTSAPIATPTPASTPTSIPQPALEESLFLEIVEPANESVVSNSPVTVGGNTTPDAVVSINGEIVEVNALGEFAVSVLIDPGPNLIEVIASDIDGKQESAVLAIIFVP